MVGRFVWTDERGDQMFGELQGEVDGDRQPDYRNVHRRDRTLLGRNGFVRVLVAICSRE
jgi:hypothetical protein